MRARRGRVTDLAVALLTVALALATACAPGSDHAGSLDPAPGYRLVPPLPADAQARADSAVRVIERMTGDGWEAHTFRGSDGGEIRYRLLPPENPRPGRRYPLVVLFHGSGEIGTDNQKQLDRFPKAWARPEIRRDYPAYVIAPQMPERSVNFAIDERNMRQHLVAARPLFTTLELIDRLRAELPVDSSRVYAMGFSMGATTTFAALALRPELFAAAIPIAGTPDLGRAEQVARTPVWIIHGNSDDAVSIVPGRVFYPLVSGVPGARVTFWEYDAGEHRVPVELLSSDAFPRWLWGHRKP